MDATAMAFDEGSFDLIIDKGTMDALLYDPTETKASQLLQEIERVCAKAGYFYLVTHGGPEKRQDLFRNSFREVEIEYIKQNLSDQVNFINIVRANGGGKNFNEVVLDPELMKKVMYQFRASSILLRWKEARRKKVYESLEMFGEEESKF